MNAKLGAEKQQGSRQMSKKQGLFVNDLNGVEKCRDKMPSILMGCFATIEVDALVNLGTVF